MFDNIDLTRVECVANQLKDNEATGREDQTEEDIFIFISFSVFISFLVFISSSPRESQEVFICFFQQPAQLSANFRRFWLILANLPHINSVSICWDLNRRLQSFQFVSPCNGGEVMSPEAKIVFHKSVQLRPVTKLLLASKFYWGRCQVNYEEWQISDLILRLQHTARITYYGVRGCHSLER